MAYWVMESLYDHGVVRDGFGTCAKRFSLTFHSFGVYVIMFAYVKVPGPFLGALYSYGWIQYVYHDNEGSG